MIQSAKYNNFSKIIREFLSWSIKRFGCFMTEQELYYFSVCFFVQSLFKKIPERFLKILVNPINSLAIPLLIVLYG